MNKGVITESGNHDSLLKNYPAGVYAKLVKQQENAEGQESMSPGKNVEYGDETDNQYQQNSSPVYGLNMVDGKYNTGNKN